MKLIGLIALLTVADTRSNVSCQLQYTANEIWFLRNIVDHRCDQTIHKRKMSEIQAELKLISVH